MNTRMWMVAALALGLMAACGGDDERVDPPVENEPPPAEGAGGAPGEDPPPEEPEPEVAELDRHVGRMTIEQLARSIPIVTDGLRWVEDFGQGETDMLMVLAPTLGAPDYSRVTEENLEPTLIIAKFLQDASQRICLRWVDRDMSLPAAERSLVQHDDWSSLDDDLVRANLAELQLRFYARHVADPSDATLDPLHTLFVDASSTAPPERAARDGWLAVCIAMMTDPEFVLY